MFRTSLQLAAVFALGALISVLLLNTMFDNQRGRAAMPETHLAA